MSVLILEGRFTSVRPKLANNVEVPELLTLMAGALLVTIGVTGLGSAVRFLPRRVIIGLTDGIALLIASTQIKDFLGLKT